MVRPRGFEGLAFLAPALDRLLCRTFVVNIIIVTSSIILITMNKITICNSIIIFPFVNVHSSVVITPDPRSIVYIVISIVSLVTTAIIVVNINFILISPDCWFTMAVITIIVQINIIFVEMLVIIVLVSVLVISPNPHSIPANSIQANHISADDIFPSFRDTSRIDATGSVVADPETRDQDVEDPGRASVELGFECAEQQLRRIRKKSDQTRHAEHVEVDVCSPGYGHGPL